MSSSGAAFENWFRALPVGPKRFYGVYAERSAGWEVGRQECDGPEDDCHAQKGDRVAGADAVEPAAK